VQISNTQTLTKYIFLSQVWNKLAFTQCKIKYLHNSGFVAKSLGVSSNRIIFKSIILSVYTRLETFMGKMTVIKFSQTWLITLKNFIESCHSFSYNISKPNPEKEHTYKHTLLKAMGRFSHFLTYIPYVFQIILKFHDLTVFKSIHE
jgi:hypothetical protein